MIRFPILASAALAAVFSLAAPPAGAKEAAKTETPQASTFKPAPYDDKLVQLAEILGSLDFIRNLCESDSEPQWKAMMAALIDSDAKDEPARKEKLTAAYNRGYRTYAAIQTACSEQLRATADRYRIEGATLATEIATRFGN